MFPVLLILLLSMNTVWATPLLKGGVEYTLPKAKKAKLRVTQIPTQYSWIERDEDWNVVLPELGSTIVAENIEAVSLQGPYGEYYILAPGSKFYAKLVDSSKPGFFNRRSNVKLSFYKLELPDHTQIKFGDQGLDFDSHKKSHAVIDTVGTVAKAGAYALGGAIAAPLLTFKIASGSFLGLGAAANPYVLGGAAAIGGGIGLAYGIKKKGKSYQIEPGTELKLKIEGPWYISQNDNEVNLNKAQGSGLGAQGNVRAQSPEPRALKKLILNVLKVKKAKDEFGDRCLRVTVDYENHTGEELRYLSFQLVDSMGKEYEPSITSFDRNIFGELPRKAQLNLYFATDFPKAIHQLKVLRMRDQKVLAQAKVMF